MTINRIAEKLGMEPATIRRHAHKVGFELERGKARDFSAEETKKIIESVKDAARARNAKLKPGARK